MKKYRRLGNHEDAREKDNVIRVAVPRSSSSNVDLMDDIKFYKNWVPTSLQSYEQNYDQMMRENDSRHSRKLGTDNVDRGDYAAAVIDLFDPKFLRSKRKSKKYFNKDKFKSNNRQKFKNRNTSKSSTATDGVKKDEYDISVKVGIKPPLPPIKRPPGSPPSPPRNSPPLFSPVPIMADLMAPPPPSTPSTTTSTTTLSTTSTPTSTIVSSTSSLYHSKKKFNKTKQKSFSKTPNHLATYAKNNDLKEVIENVYDFTKDIQNDGFNINIHDDKFSIKPSVTYDNSPDIIENNNRDSVTHAPEIFNDIEYHPQTNNHFKRGTTSRPKTFSSPLSFFPQANKIRHLPSPSISQSGPSSSISSSVTLNEEESLTGDHIFDEFQTNFRTVDKEVLRRQVLPGNQVPILRQKFEMNMNGNRRSGSPSSYSFEYDHKKCL